MRPGAGRCAGSCRDALNQRRHCVPIVRRTVAAEGTGDRRRCRGGPVPRRRFGTLCRQDGRQESRLPVALRAWAGQRNGATIGWPGMTGSRAPHVAALAMVGALVVAATADRTTVNATPAPAEP